MGLFARLKVSAPVTTSAIGTSTTSSFVTGLVDRIKRSAHSIRSRLLPRVRLEHMGQEREILELAVHAVTEQGAKADALFDGGGRGRPHVPPRANGTPAIGRMAVLGSKTWVQRHAKASRRPIGTGGSERRLEGKVVDMAIALWVIAVVACCVLCAWGLATAVRRSRERHAQAARH